MSLGFSVLGDSISTLGGYNPEGWRLFYEGEAHIEGVERPSDTWWGKVIEHYGGHLVSNASFSGAVVEGYGFPAGVSDERVAGLMGTHGEAPDVVLFLMGINDYGWGGGRNQVMGQSPSASAKPEDLEGPKEVTALAPEGALDLFEDAYALTINKIKALAPKAEVWCVNLAPGSIKGVNWNSFVYQIRGIHLDEYNKAIARAAEREGAKLVDVRAFGVDYDSVEGVHPTALGMQQLATMIISQLEGKPADPALYPELEGLRKSVRGCDKPSCEGCEFVEILKQRWSLFCTKDAPSN